MFRDFAEVENIVCLSLGFFGILVNVLLVLRWLFPSWQCESHCQQCYIHQSFTSVGISQVGIFITLEALTFWLMVTWRPSGVCLHSIICIPGSIIAIADKCKHIIHVCKMFFFSSQNTVLCYGPQNLNYNAFEWKLMLITKYCMDT